MGWLQWSLQRWTQGGLSLSLRLGLSGILLGLLSLFFISGQGLTAPPDPPKGASCMVSIFGGSKVR